MSLPDEEIRQTSIFSKDGKFVKNVTADSIAGALFVASEQPEYRKLKPGFSNLYRQWYNQPSSSFLFQKLDVINKQKADSF